MDKRLMHYVFPRDQIQLDGTMAELPGKVAAVVEDSTDAAIVAAILAAARAEEVTDLYLIDKTFILDAIREKLEREKLEREKPSQAAWIYWDGWCGNHDRRIDDATCSGCGYKHPTVWATKTEWDTPKFLSDTCPGCGAKMKKGEGHGN